MRGGIGVNWASVCLTCVIRRAAATYTTCVVAVQQPSVCGVVDYCLATFPHEKEDKKKKYGAATLWGRGGGVRKEGGYIPCTPSENWSVVVVGLL